MTDDALADDPLAGQPFLGESQLRALRQYGNEEAMAKGQDIAVKQAMMAFLDIGLIVENRCAAEQYAEDYCGMRDNVT
jgi:hypothetical protein